MNGLEAKPFTNRSFLISNSNLNDFTLCSCTLPEIRKSSRQECARSFQ